MKNEGINSFHSKVYMIAQSFPPIFNQLLLLFVWEKL
jgi:hypothetical protein